MTNSWERINGQTADRIDVLNFQMTLALIEVKLLFSLDKGGLDSEGGCALPPSSADVIELHRFATQYLLDEPGVLRTRHVQVKSATTGTVYFDPPQPHEIARHLRDLDTTLARAWPHASPVAIASYVLWRINWIHPFVNGNGHTARAFAYLALCYKYGFMLPGDETVVDMITADREGYCRALAYASNTLRTDGRADLGPMENYLAKMVNRQLGWTPPA